MRRFRILALGLFLGCATSGVRTAHQQTLSDQPVPAGQTCEVVGTPAVLPAPTELADTGALASIVEREAMGLSHVLLSLRYDSSGMLTRLRVIDPDLVEDDRERIEQAITPALINRAEAPAFTVRLRVERMGAPRFRTGRSERCLPSPKAVTDAYFSPPPGLSSDRVVGKEVLMLRWNVLIDAEGRLLEAKRIGSDNLPADMLQSYETNLRQMPWNPGLDDGVPTPMRTTYTTRVEIVKAVRRIG